MKVEQAFGIVLKKYRTSIAITQEELAYRSSLDRTFISLLERGLRKPTLTTIFVLSNSLGIKPNVIVQEVELLINENNTN